MMKPKAAHRQRLCGTPVRTGCITCKIRRVKCGEEKPFCKRCTSTGRKCDGYAPINQPTAQFREPSPKPLHEDLEDSKEQRLFHFFRTTTAPVLSGHFSNDFWERIVLEASAVEPSIRHAVIAIGAVHQDFILRHESNDEFYDPSIKALAFRQYTKAISHLQRLMSTRTQQLDFTLISCILFICFDCISGNHDSAIIHLKAGLKILEDIKKRNTQTMYPDQTTTAHKWERQFAPLLLNLGVQVASFVNPRDRKDRIALWTLLKGVRVPTHPITFQSIDEAQHALETTIADIMADRITTDDRISASQIPTPKGTVCRKHVAAMDAWMQALNRYLEGYTGMEIALDQPNLAANTLKLHWLVLSIVISIPEPANKKFEEILLLCNSLIPENRRNLLDSSNITFSANIGIICPLFFTALRAPKIALRREALELLSRSPRHEGMWDSDDAILLAEEAIKDVEERGGSDISTIPPNTPEYERMIWNDISARIRSRFNWPLAVEQDNSIFSTSFSHGFPFTRSDLVEPGPPTTGGNNVERPDYQHKQ